MTIATLTSKGQMTLPKNIRDDLGLKEGDKVEFVTLGTTAIIVPRNQPIDRLFGLLSAHATSGTELDEYDDAVREGVADHVDGDRRKSGTKGHAA